MNYEVAWKMLKVAVMQKLGWTATEILDTMLYCEIESLGMGEKSVVEAGKGALKAFKK